MVPARAGNWAASATVCRSVKTRGPLPEATALLLSFVEALQERLDSDPSLQAACASLRHLGLHPLVRVELASGIDVARVLVADERQGVPQWTEKDAEVLRSVGIASETSSDADPSPPQPRRRQPR